MTEDQKDKLIWLVADKIFNLPQIGYYGPPTDPAENWVHIKSCRYNTRQEAQEAYKKYYDIKCSNKTGHMTPDDFDGGSLCYWQENWGPIVVPDLDLYGAFNVISNLTGRGRIFSCESTVPNIEKAATYDLTNHIANCVDKDEYGPYEIKFKKFECPECKNCNENWCFGNCSRVYGEFKESVFLSALKSVGVDVSEFLNGK